MGDGDKDAGPEDAGPVEGAGPAPGAVGWTGRISWAPGRAPIPTGEEEST